MNKIGIDLSLYTRRMPFNLLNCTRILYVIYLLLDINSIYAVLSIIAIHRPFIREPLSMDIVFRILINYHHGKKSLNYFLYIDILDVCDSSKKMYRNKIHIYIFCL